MQRAEPKEFNFEDLEMQKWNIITDKTQRVDEKNGSFVYWYCLFPVTRVTMSKAAHFLVFSALESKKCHRLGNIFKYIWLWKRTFSPFRKCRGLWGSELRTISKISNLENTGSRYFLFTQVFSSIYDER